MTPNEPKNFQSQPASTNRTFDLTVNAMGVLAILCMASAFIGPRYFDKFFTDTVAGDIRWAGWIFIGLYVLGSVWQSRQWLWGTAKSERGQSGINLILQIALALVLVGFVDYLGTRHHVRWDLTENHQYSLSQQTIKILKDLPGKVSVTMFSNPVDRSSQNTVDLWQEYAYAGGDKLSFRAIDPDRHTQDALKFIQSLPKDQQSKVMNGDSIRLGTIMLEYQGRVTPVTGYNEQDFTSALLKATETQQKVIYWLEGHGEADPASYQGQGMSQVESALEKQNYKIDKLPLYTEKTGVPADAAAVVIAGPQTPYSPTELADLTSYVKHGGHVYLALRYDARTDLGTWLDQNFGVNADRDLVLEMNPALTVQFNPTNPAVVKYPFHDITQSFQNYRIATVFPMTRSFTIGVKLPDGVTASPLAQSSPMSQGRMSAGPIKAADLTRPFDPTKDLKGPLDLAVAITVDTKNPNPAPVASGSVQPVNTDFMGRVVAVGSPFFAENQLAQSNFGNSDFFLSAMNWLTEDRDLISIPPKATETRTVDLLGGTQQKVFYGSVLAPPLVLLFLAGLVFWRRR